MAKDNYNIDAEIVKAYDSLRARYSGFHPYLQTAFDVIFPLDSGMEAARNAPKGKGGMAALKDAMTDQATNVATAGVGKVAKGASKGVSNVVKRVRN